MPGTRHRNEELPQMVQSNLRRCSPPHCTFEQGGKLWIDSQLKPRVLTHQHVLLLKRHYNQIQVVRVFDSTIWARVRNVVRVKCGSRSFESIASPRYHNQMWSSFWDTGHLHGKVGISTTVCECLPESITPGRCFSFMRQVWRDIFVQTIFLIPSIITENHDVKQTDNPFLHILHVVANRSIWRKPGHARG